MDYLVHSDMSEEIDNREADPLTGNIIGAAIDVHLNFNVKRLIEGIRRMNV